MKNIFILLVIGLIVLGCDQTNKSDSEVNNDNQITIGQIDSVKSDILGETRNIWVHLPTNYQEGKRYPVLYLLDGSRHFYSVTGLIKQLSTTNGNTVLPEMIVIGIPNTNRGRDLTPTHVDIDFFTGDSIQYDNGGGDRFLEFIESELIPYVDKTYPTTSFRTYVGHSFGGLSVINALTTRSQIFNNYVAIDPSLWWDDMAYLKTVDSLLSVNNFDNKRLFVGVANTMSKGQDISTIEADTSKRSAHIRSILRFVKSQETRSNGLIFNWKYYNEDSHGSVPLIALYDALRFLFSWYEFSGMNELYGSSLPIDESIELLKSHYENVSQKMGYEVLPDESLVNNLGYFYMSEKKMERAAAFFNLNVLNFPESNNVYDSKGDWYLAAGDSLKALESFRKAVEIGDNDDSQEKIDMLSKALESK